MSCDFYAINYIFLSINNKPLLKWKSLQTLWINILDLTKRTIKLSQTNFCTRVSPPLNLNTRRPIGVNIGQVLAFNWQKGAAIVSSSSSIAGCCQESIHKLLTLFCCQAQDRKLFVLSLVEFFVSWRSLLWWKCE